MTREPPDVCNERGLRTLVEQGWHLVVVAYEDAELRKQGWSGAWGIRVARPDGAKEYMLVISRPPNDERRISTMDAVVSLLDKYGLAQIQVPLRAGGRSINVPPARWRPD